MKEKTTRLFIKLLTVSALCLFGTAYSWGQQKNNQDSTKDLIDIFNSITKDRFKKKNDSGPSKKFILSVVPAAGYTLQSGFAGILSGNISFYAANQKNQNLSTVNSNISFSQKDQFTIVAQPNLWTKDNKINLVGDYRFYIYPQKNYGLGGHTQLSNESEITYDMIRLYQTVYFKIHNSLYAGVGYNLSYHYNVRETETPNGAPTIFDRYGNEKQTTSSGISVDVLSDKRGNPNNPVSGGRYLSIQLQNYLQPLGSTNSWEALIVDARKYIGTSKHNDNKLALWGYGWFTFDNHAPYLDLPSTGWDAYNNLGRGYIQNRFRGKNLIYGEAEYRMTFTKNGLLGGVVFANAQSVTDLRSNRFTTLHPATGAGIRLKFNKHSNSNIAIDYGFGTDGSKGVFVNLGEVF